jgi:hypothetical protein
VSDGAPSEPLHSGAPPATSTVPAVASGAARSGDGFGDVCDQDVDDDGITGIPDVNLWRLHIGTSDPLYDWNLDGVVDTVDVAEFDLGTAPGPSAQSPDVEEVWSQALSGQPVAEALVGAPPRPIFLLEPAGLRGSCLLQLDR